jgi:Fe-S-cluster containining protein
VVSERDIWMDAAGRTEVVDALREMVAEAEAAVRARRPLCVSQGACCSFERFGHQLWMTGLEVAWCLRQLPATPGVTAIDDAVRRGECPFLREGACSVHWARPLGCRAYFCDGAGEGWQEALLESWHGRVRTLHERLQIPYRYDEWRRLLRVFAEPA